MRILGEPECAVHGWLPLWLQAEGAQALWKSFPLPLQLPGTSAARILACPMEI